MSKKRKTVKRQSMTKRQTEDLYDFYMNVMMMPDDCIRELFDGVPNYKEIVVNHFENGGFEKLVNRLQKIFDDPKLLARVLDPDSGYYSERAKHLIKKYHLHESI